MTERRSATLLLTMIVLIAAISLGPSLTQELLADSGQKTDEGRKNSIEADRGRQDSPAILETCHEAAQTLESMLADPDSSIPDALLARAEAIAVIPGTVPAEADERGRTGRGLLSRSTGNESWSSPVIVSVHGARFGGKLDVERADLVLVFTRAQDVDTLVGKSLVLGGQTTVSAGPLGRDTDVAPSTDLGEVFSWSRVEGTFASMALDGAMVRIEGKANSKLYGEGFQPEATLAGEAETPRAAEAFHEVLSQRTTRVGL